MVNDISDIYKGSKESITMHHWLNLLYLNVAGFLRPSNPDSE